MKKTEYALEIMREFCGERFKIPLSFQADIIIICINTGSGLAPVEICLPHQFGVSKVDQLFLRHPDLRQITIIPAKSAHYIELFKEWLD